MAAVATSAPSTMMPTMTTMATTATATTTMTASTTSATTTTTTAGAINNSSSSNSMLLTTNMAASSLTSGGNSCLDEQIERLKRCEYLREGEVKALCLRAREILVDESNVQRVDAPVTVSWRELKQVYCNKLTSLSLSLSLSFSSFRFFRWKDLR
jgi:hypothetical protein